MNLSKRFKNDWKTWLAEDKAAQENRHNKPDAMDIYDTINTQGMAYIHVYTWYSNYLNYFFCSSDPFCNTTRAYVRGIQRKRDSWSDVLDFLWNQNPGDAVSRRQHFNCCLSDTNLDLQTCY